MVGSCVCHGACVIVPTRALSVGHVLTHGACGQAIKRVARRGTAWRLRPHAACASRERCAGFGTCQTPKAQSGRRGVGPTMVMNSLRPRLHPSTVPRPRKTYLPGDKVGKAAPSGGWWMAAQDRGGASECVQGKGPRRGHWDACSWCGAVLTTDAVLTQCCRSADPTADMVRVSECKERVRVAVDVVAEVVPVGGQERRVHARPTR